MSVATDRGSKLLIVDDDAGGRTFLRLSLELEGFSVVEACNGPEALSLLSDDIDACITDLTMPCMDGIELISLVHQIRQDLPVLIISGNFRQYANRLTSLNWVQKPFSSGEVARRVRELIAKLEGRKKHSQTIDDPTSSTRAPHSRIHGGADGPFDQDEQ
jgi:CheY-like chemotaxis protein